MSRADLKRSVPEFTIVKAEAKAPHVAPAPSAFLKRSAIPELVGYPAETVYSAGSESPLKIELIESALSFMPNSIATTDSFGAQLLDSHVTFCVMVHEHDIAATVYSA